MPKKINGAGQMQEYIPAGNGKASGEYGTSSGENKHFQKFGKETKNQIYVIRNYYGLGGDRYIDKNRYDEYKNSSEPYYRDLVNRIEIKDINYNDDEIKNQMKDIADDLIQKNPTMNFNQFKFAMQRMMDADEFNFFMTDNDDNYQWFDNLYQDYKNKGLEIQSKQKQEKYNQAIAKGKEALSKLPKFDGPRTVNENVISVNKENYDKTQGLYWSDKKQYDNFHKNCQICVQCFELTARGYNVQAAERPVGGTKEYDALKNAGWSLAMYETPEEGFEFYGDRYWTGMEKLGRGERQKSLVNHNGQAQKKDIERIVTEAGNGARFQCNVNWIGRGAHVFSIVNDNGKVRFIDAQSGEEDVSYYFEPRSIKPSDTMLIRVDNLELNENVNMVARGKKNGN